MKHISYHLHKRIKTHAKSTDEQIHYTMHQPHRAKSIDEPIKSGANIEQIVKLTYCVDATTPHVAIKNPDIYNGLHASLAFHAFEYLTN